MCCKVMKEAFRMEFHASKQCSVTSDLDEVWSHGAHPTRIFCSSKKNNQPVQKAYLLKYILLPSTGALTNGICGYGTGKAVMPHHHHHSILRYPDFIHKTYTGWGHDPRIARHWDGVRAQWTRRAWDPSSYKQVSVGKGKVSCDDDVSDLIELSSCSLFSSSDVKEMSFGKIKKTPPNAWK